MLGNHAPDSVGQRPPSEHRRVRSPSYLAVPVLLMAGYAGIVLLHVVFLSPYFQAGVGAYYVPVKDVIIGAPLGDEALYRLYAVSLLHLGPYPTSPFYPPAYPLLLMLAELLSPGSPIQAMIVLNIAAASAVMFPVYALTRQMLARDLAFGAAMVAGVLPASFIFAPALMSENLSTTIFATAFWLALRQRSATPAVSALFGAALALCFLTKFLFLPTIPLLGIAFMINQWLMTAPLERSSRWARMVRMGVVAAAAGILLVALWSAYLVASGGTVAQSLGIHMATGSVDPKTTLDLLAGLPPLAYLPSILGLHGLALIAIALPILPLVLVAIPGGQRRPIFRYTILLGTMTAFMWLFITAYAWFSLKVFTYPQPICERYLMMLVPLVVPLAFVGLERMLDRMAIWRRWQTLAMASIFSLALSILVQVGFYDRAIWPVPEWTTIVWVGGPDVLYGALGFPVIIVTAVATGALLALEMAVWFDLRSSLVGQRAFRFGVIATVTAGLAVFNVATGMAGARFAWDSPYLALNAAHGRAITAIIGDQSRDPRPALVSVDPAVLETIETATGIRLLEPSGWWPNLSFWSGRWVTVNGAEDRSENLPRYWVSMARPGADPATVYRVGGESFQVKPAPDP
jgi:hypothetical protein